MYPIINENCVLRSWSNIQYFAVFDILRDYLIRIEESEYKFLSLCDGTRSINQLEEIAEPAEHVRQHIEFFQKNGIIRIEDCNKTVMKKNLPHDSNVFIRNVCWLITGDCNLVCEHCYMRAPDNYWKGSLDWSQIEKILDEFTKCNVLSVVFTGGEPTLRPDFIDLVKAVHNRGIRVRGINTNGTLLLKNDLLSQLKELGYPIDIAFSLDGIEFHQRFRKNTNFSTVIEAIQESLSMGMNPTINTCVTKSNINEIKSLYDYVKELGISSWKLNFPNRIGRWHDHNTSSMNNTEENQHSKCKNDIVSVREEVKLYKEIYDKWIKDGKPFELSLGKVFRTGKCSGTDKENEIRDEYDIDSYACNYYRDDLVIMPDGSLLGCNALYEISQFNQTGNILNQSLADIWESKAMRSFKDLKVKDIIAHNSDCQTCKQLKYCGTGCRITAYAETGNFLSIDPRICEMMKNYHSYFEGTK